MNHPGRPIISLVGGMAISNGAGKYGTLGLVTGRVGKDGNEKIGFLTAGHVLGKPSSIVEAANTVIGTVELNPYLDPDSAIDVAFVEIAPGVVCEEQSIRTPPHDTYKITEHVNIPLQGHEVIMQGARSRTKRGVVSYPKATITFEGTVLQNVSLATYESEPGDSGAPVFYINSQQEKKASLLGIHGGKIHYDQQWYSWFTPLETIETIIELW